MRYLILIIFTAFLLVVTSCGSSNDPSAPTLEITRTFTVTPDPGELAEPAAGPETGEVIVEKQTSKKSQVLENCRIVQAAVEEFAARNGGTYPGNSADVTPDGYTLVDFLPDGRLLENPYREVQSEPITGQTGYLPVICGDQVRGYSITGVGRTPGQNIVWIMCDCSGELTETIGRLASY